MCLAIPARVVELPEPDARRIDIGGVRKACRSRWSTASRVGDYVIVHVGYALAQLDPAEAERTLALFAEAGLTAARWPS